MHHISDAVGASARAPAEDPRPPRTTVAADAIPKKLRDTAQWVVWQYERDENDTKWTKVPYQAVPGQQYGASSTNPTTWTTFLAAYRYYEANGWVDGIGFVVSAADSYCGVDLDHCRDPLAGTVDPWARSIVAELPTYWEVSPSGAGLRAFCEGSLPPKDRKHGSVEMYETGRFLTVTGHTLPGSLETIEPCTEALARVHAEHIVEARAKAKAEKAAAREAARKATPEATTDGGVASELAPARTNGHVAGPLADDEIIVTDPKNLSDDDVIHVAGEAKNGDKFGRLWRGDTSDYRTKDNEGRNEADAALCAMLGFYCRGRRDQIERLFRRSGLYREKWDRDDYRERTIDLALGGKSEFYGDAPPEDKVVGRMKLNGKVHTTYPNGRVETHPVDPPTKNGHTGSSSDGSSDVSPNDEDEDDQESEGGFSVSLFFRRGFPTECLPDAIREYVEAAALATGAPAGFVALPMLVFAGTTAGNEHRIEIKAGYAQRPVLFGGVVAPTGSTKSPGIREARYPLDVLQTEAHEGYEEALRNFEHDLRDWEALSKADQKDVPKPVKPIMGQFYTTNSTLEALTCIVRDGRGVAVAPDELTALVHGMDAYRGGKGGDRQAFLSLWSGEPLKVDRKGQEPLFVQHPVVGVVGGIQPDVMRDLAKDGRRDGFIDRFLWDASPAPVARWREDTVGERLRSEVVDIFRRLRQSKTDRPVILSPEAKTRWTRWYDSNAEAVEQSTGLLRGIYSKFPLQLARIALVLHCLTHPDDPTSRSVSDDTLADAIDIAEYYRHNANMVVQAFGAPLGNASAGLADRVLRFLRANRAVEDGWVTRTAINDHLGGKILRSDIGPALAGIEASGQAEMRRRPHEGGKGGRPTEEWRFIETEGGKTEKRNNPTVSPGSGADEPRGETSEESAEKPFAAPVAHVEEDF